ncbi:MAG: hypothetical protein HUU06_06880 [Planctomycetaceae bacterium]|nr:hypothetical protein [Planctomycetota bacterium]NUN52494.1 hypothetical protein [Planctomycetaceae bacterium]
MARARLLAPLLLLAGGCAAPAGTAPAPAPVEAVGAPGIFPPVLDAEGRPYPLGDLLQDRILSETRDGRPSESIDRVDWLLVVASRPACEWTRRFLGELEAVLPDLRSLHVRTAAVLEGEFGEHEAEWERIRASGIPVLRDPAGAVYRFHVQKATPALALLDRWGTVVFELDGYMAPADLALKIRAGDFASVKAAGG